MRDQSKSAVAYIFRNFLHLAPWALVSAALMGMFFNGSNYVSLFTHLQEGNVNDYNAAGTVLHYFSVLRFKDFDSYWWGAIVAIVVLAFTLSLLMVKVERHMQIGEMKVFPLRRTMAVFPAMLLFVVCVTLFVEGCNLVTAGIAYLLRSLGATVVVSVSFALAFLFRMLFMLVLGTLMVAFPIMFVEHYALNQAMSYSVRLMSEKRRFLWTIATVYPLCEAALTALCGFIGVQAVAITLFSVMYLFCMLLIPAVTFRIYFECVGGERRDIGRKIFG